MSNKEMPEIDETQEKTEDKIKASEGAANNLEDEGVYTADSPECLFSPQDFREQLQSMADIVRLQFGIPIRGNREIIGGWNVDGRRIDITRWYQGEGNRIMVEKLQEKLQDENIKKSVCKQLDRVENQFSKLDPPRHLDVPLVLAIAFRESGSNAFSWKSTPVHTYYSGGLDNFGENAPKLMREGYLPRNFPYRQADPVENERGNVVQPALVPANRMIEAYAARIEMAKDAFIRAAKSIGFDVKNIDKNTERAWTMAFFAAPRVAEKILENLGKKGGKLSNIFTDKNLEKYDIIKRARVTAAEAYMLDRLREIGDETKSMQLKESDFGIRGQQHIEDVLEDLSKFGNKLTGDIEK